MRPDPVEEGKRWYADDAEKALRQAQRIIRQVAEFLEHERSA